MHRKQLTHIFSLLLLFAACFLGGTLLAQATASEAGESDNAGNETAGTANEADASASKSWGLSYQEEGKRPQGTDTLEELAAHGAYYARDTEEKVLYLTFDCGYENGNTAIYILGSAGYATECTYKLSDQVRKYTFTYSGEYLTRIDEEINSTPYSSVELAYDDNGNLSHIIANGLQTNYQAGNTENLYQLPCLQVCETYPLSFHNDAIYAGLLGRQSKHLIIGNTPEENKEEYTKYTYELDENEKPTGIIAKTTSTGTVIDINGNAYDETKTDTRTIGITIE